MSTSRPRPSGILVSLVVVGILFALAPGATAAQDLRYRTVSDVEFAGMMGTMMRLSGESADPDTSTTWVKGSLIRQDDGTSTTITDLSTMEMTMIDHEESTWWTMSLADMMASAQESMAEMEAEMEAQREAGEEAPELKTSFDVDRTDERRTINGFEAERVILTMEVEQEVEAEAPEDPESDPGAAMMGAGTMTWVSELWVSPDVPTWRIVRDAMGEDAGSIFESDASMGSMMAANPQMQAAAEEMAEEMEGMEGETVRSSTYMVLVTTGNDFDREAVLAMGDEPLPQGPSLSDLMASAAAEAGRNAAMDAAKSRLGRLGGLFGGGDDEEDEEEAPEAPKQVVLMRMVTEIVDVEEVSLDPSDFQPPAGYTRVEGPSMGR